MNGPSGSDTPLGGRILTGAMVITMASWTGKLLRLLLYFLMARLLSVEEFGIAVALGVLIGMQTLIDTLGFQSSLVQQRSEPTREELNAAWTLDNLSTRLFMGLVYLLFGPLIARGFGLESMGIFVQLVAVVAFAKAMENSAMVILMRRLDYVRRAAMQLADTGTAVLVVLALLGAGERHGWIVVAGAIGGTSARTMASYLLYPYIPSIRIDREVIRLKFRFSSWLFLLQLVRRLRLSLDRLLVGGLAGVVPLAIYQLGAGLTQDLANDLERTSNTMVFPAIAQIQQYPQRVTAALSRTLELSSLLTFVLCGLLYLHADPVITIVLGGKWAMAVAVLRISCVAGTIHAVLATLNPVLRGTGRSDLEFLHHFSAIPLIVAFGIAWIPSDGALGMARAVLAAEIALIPLWFWILRRVAGTETIRIFRALASPAMLAVLTLALSYLGIAAFGRPASLLSLGIHLGLPPCLLAAVTLRLGNRALPRNGDAIRVGAQILVRRLNQRRAAQPS